MRLQLFFELFTSLVNPKHLASSPFFESDDVRLNTNPPSILKAMSSYIVCTKQALNTRMIGFCDTTLMQCVENLKMDMKANPIIADPSALQKVLARRRGEIEVDTLPWEPREEYKVWLRQQGRLAGVTKTSDSTIGSRRILHRPDPPSQLASLMDSSRCYNSCQRPPSFSSAVAQPHTSMDCSPINRPLTSPGNTLSNIPQRPFHARAIPFKGSAEGNSFLKPQSTSPHFQDVKHYKSIATTRSHEISQMLLNNLKAYRTFQSLLASCSSHSNSSDACGGRDYASSTNPTTLDSPADGLQSNFIAHSTSPIVRSIDKLLNAATASAVRHSFDAHFIATVASIRERSTSTNLFVKPEGRHLLVHDSTASHQQPPSAAPVLGPECAPRYLSTSPHTQTSPMNLDALSEEVFRSAWARDHPHASLEQAQERLMKWRRERASSTRVKQRREVSKLQQELEEERRLVAVADKRKQSLPELNEARVKTISQGCPALKAETDRQRVLWDQFINTELPPSEDALPADSLGLSQCVVKDYVTDRSVKDWLECRGWIHRTHRHEAAALLIQRIFRGYTARAKAQRRRVTRFLAFQSALKAEEKTRQQWEVSLNIFEQGSVHGQSPRTLNAFLSFENLITAMISLRRARKAARAASQVEIANFAAISIQRIYRGHRVRRLVYGMRHPEWLAEIEHQNRLHAALYIQARWRGRHARSLVRRREKATLVIQRAYRFHRARVALAHFRFRLKKKSIEEVRSFAVQIIVRFLNRGRARLPPQRIRT